MPILPSQFPRIFLAVYINKINIPNNLLLTFLCKIESSFYVAHKKVSSCLVSLKEFKESEGARTPGASLHSAQVCQTNPLIIEKNMKSGVVNDLQEVFVKITKMLLVFSVTEGTDFLFTDILKT